jgi:hypothetical protein
MRKFILAAAALGALAVPAAPAAAQYWGGGYRPYHYDRDYRQELRECRRELRRADSRREYRRERRECRRELRDARRDSRRDWRHDRYGYSDRYHRPYGYQGYDNRRYWDGYRWRYRW